MWGAILRAFIVLLITAVAVWIGYTTYHTLYDIFDFQITLYRYLLTTQEHIGNVKDSVVTSLSSFLDILGGTSAGKAEPLGVESNSVTDRLTTFSSKLKMITGIVGALIGVFVWKILFDIIFGIKTLIQRLTSFIKEPFHS